MAEAPPWGFYPTTVDVVEGSDRLEVTAGWFGPAGASAAELPDGSIWEVDHIDPGRLVGLEVDSADPSRSPLRIAAFGGDGALRVADLARGNSADDHPRPGLSNKWGARPQPHFDATGVGRLVLLADLARDP